ncbi:MAG: hypothetical protein ACOCZU_03165 [Planctomycetota bacterium]
MVFRIRYKDAAGCDEKLATVEANSPTEAMVKFRCIYNVREYSNETPEMVTSVAADE